MPETKLEARLPAWLTRAALLAALAVLAWTVAHWGWQFFGPRSATSVPPQRVAMKLDQFARARLFGEEATASIPPAAARVPVAGSLRLLGVMAQSQGGGIAVFRRGDGSLALAREGDEIESGQRLRRITPEAVELDGSLGQRRIILRERKTAPAPVPKSAAAAVCPLKPEDRRDAYLLYPELLAGVMRNREAQAALRKEAGGLRVTGIDALLTAMGLAEGDVIESVDGAKLSGSDALVTAIIEPLAGDRVLRLSGTRGGKPRTWVYVNAALCSGTS